MKRKPTIVMLASLIMFFWACSAQSVSAQDRLRHGEHDMKGDRKMHERMHEGAPLWRHIATLGLDDKQKAEVKEIRNRVMKETIRKKADERIAGIELRELLDNDPVDMKEVETKLKQIEALRTYIRFSHIQAMEEVKGKLTPEQRKKFKEVCEMEPMMGGRGRKGRTDRGAAKMPPPAGLAEESP